MTPELRIITLEEDIIDFGSQDKIIFIINKSLP